MFDWRVDQPSGWTTMGGAGAGVDAGAAGAVFSVEVDGAVAEGV